jgi:hypothetical protein
MLSYIDANHLEYIFPGLTTERETNVNNIVRTFLLILSPAAVHRS